MRGLTSIWVTSEIASFYRAPDVRRMGASGVAAWLKNNPPTVIRPQNLERPLSGLNRMPPLAPSG